MKLICAKHLEGENREVYETMYKKGSERLEKGDRSLPMVGKTACHHSSRYLVELLKGGVSVLVYHPYFGFHYVVKTEDEEYIDVMPEKILEESWKEINSAPQRIKDELKTRNLLKNYIEIKEMSNKIKNAQLVNLISFGFIDRGHKKVKNKRIEKTLANYGLTENITDEEWRNLEEVLEEYKIGISYWYDHYLKNE